MGLFLLSLFPAVMLVCRSVPSLLVVAKNIHKLTRDAKEHGKGWQELQGW